MNQVMMDPIVETVYEKIGRFQIFYSPCRQRFYVRNEEHKIVAMFTERRNAVYYARTYEKIGRAYVESKYVPEEGN